MKERAMYGIDAPGVVRAHIVLGGVLAAIAAISFALPRPNPVPLSLGVGVTFVAALLLSYAVVMLRSSLVSKRRLCDRLVNGLAVYGTGQVMDAGCSGGLTPVRYGKR